MPWYRLSKLSLALISLLWTAGILAFTIPRTLPDTLADDVFSLLTNTGACPQPCWAGIRPGVSGSGDAVDTLRELPWVTNITAIQGIVINDSVINWSWTGQQPAIIDADRQGRMWLHNGKVYSIELPLNIWFATVWNAAGKPDQIKNLKAPRSPPAVFYHMLYFEGRIDFRGIVPCPPSAYALFAMDVDARFASEIDPTIRSASFTKDICQ